MVLPLSLLAANVSINATNKISLVDWQTVFVTNPPVTPFNWTDTVSTNVPRRFYRAVLGPPWP